MFGDKLMRRRLTGNARDTRASVQWPAVKKTRADTSVPEQNSPNVPSACWVRIAPTFGWVVSIVPQVMAWDRAARATTRTTPNTPSNRDTRAHRLPNSTATLPAGKERTRASLRLGHSGRTRGPVTRRSSDPVRAAGPAEDGSPAAGRPA